MITIHFPDWQEALECDSELSAKDRAAHLIAIRWFLSYCRKVSRPANGEQAHAFIKEACELKRPTDWMVGRWKEAINWFFLHAPKAGDKAGDEGGLRGSGSGGDERAVQENCVPGEPRRRGPSVQPARLAAAEPEWRLKMVKGLGELKRVVSLPLWSTSQHATSLHNGKANWPLPPRTARLAGRW